MKDLKIRWYLAVRCCLLLVVAASPVCAQRQASPALQALAAQDYAACLTHAATDLAGVAQRPALEPVLAVALALEKTQGWTGAHGARVRELLAPSADATRYLQAVKRLLQGDTTGVPALFDGAPPAPQALAAGARLAREHGFPLAADCLTAMSPDLPGKRVLAVVSIPADLRGPVEETLARTVSAVNLRMLAESALNLYIAPPPDLGDIDPAELLAFAKRYAHGLEVVSLATAHRLLQARRKEAALAMVGEVVAAHPTGPDARDAARLFWEQGQYDAAGAIYRALMTHTPESERLLRK